jgi:hypothetical protein
MKSYIVQDIECFCRETRSISILGIIAIMLDDKNSQKYFEQETRQKQMVSI